MTNIEELLTPPDITEEMEKYGKESLALCKRVLDEVWTRLQSEWDIKDRGDRSSLERLFKLIKAIDEREPPSSEDLIDGFEKARWAATELVLFKTVADVLMPRIGPRTTLETIVNVLNIFTAISMEELTKLAKQASEGRKAASGLLEAAKEVAKKIQERAFHASSSCSDSLLARLGRDLWYQHCWMFRFEPSDDHEAVYGTAFLHRKTQQVGNQTEWTVDLWLPDPTDGNTFYSQLILITPSSFVVADVVAATTTKVTEHVMECLTEKIKIEGRLAIKDFPLNCIGDALPERFSRATGQLCHMVDEVYDLLNSNPARHMLHLIALTKLGLSPSGEPLEGDDV